MTMFKVQFRNTTDSNDDTYTKRDYEKDGKHKTLQVYTMTLLKHYQFRS